MGLLSGTAVQSVAGRMCCLGQQDRGRYLHSEAAPGRPSPLSWYRATPLIEATCTGIVLLPAQSKVLAPTGI